MATKPPTTGRFAWDTPYRGQGVAAVPSDVWDDDLFTIFDNIDNALNFIEGITPDTAASGDPIIKVEMTQSPAATTIAHRLYDGGGIAPCGFAVGSGVTSLNALIGDLTIAAGTAISVTPSGGDTLTIAYTGAAGGVTSLNALVGALTIAAGASISVTPSGGDTLTIAYTGGGGVAHTGLTDMPDVAGTNIDHDARYGGAGWAGTAKLKSIIDAIIANSDAVNEAGIGSGTHFHAYYAP